MKPPYASANKKGFSLIEVMVATGLIGIIALAFATMMDNQNKQIKYLESKQDVVNVKNALLRALGENSTCCPFADTTIGDLTFSTLTPSPSVSFQNFFRSCVGTPPPVFLSLGANNGELPSLSVTSMSINNLTGVNDTYSGEVQIKMTPKNLGFMDPKPISLAVTFKTQDAGVNTKRIVSCNAGAVVTNKLALQCVDLQNTCTIGSGSLSCDSPSIPADYVITGGSCISASDNGAGRLLTMATISGNHWACRAKDHATASAGSLTAIVHACALNDPTLPTPTLDCQTVTTSCGTSGNSWGYCATGSPPAGYVLVGGGCFSNASPAVGRLLVGSYPNATSTGWICSDKDHATAVAGTLITSAIFCKISTGIVGTLNCKMTSDAVPAVSDNPLNLNLAAPAGYTLTSVGCNTINSPAGRLLTSLSMSTSPSQSVSCAEKDHATATGGLTTIYSIGCTF